jgi:hypothetical protein
LRTLIEDRVIEGATHSDFESPTDQFVETVCGKADPARQAIVRQTLHQAVREWLLRPAATTASTPLAADKLHGH